MELTIGSKTLPTTFVIKDGGLVIYCWVGIGYMPIAVYHRNVSSKRSVEMVQEETSMTVAATEAQGWTYDQVSCISEKAWDTKYLKVSNFGLQLAQAVGSDDRI
jgi:hypothetical protein